MIKIIKKLFSTQKQEIHDPYREQAIADIEKFTSLPYSDIKEIRKDGTAIYIEDLAPILLIDLLKAGWKAS